MDDLTKGVLFAISLIIVLFVFGAIVYNYLEGWGLVDSIYFMTSTVTTVGYGDTVYPLTDEGKLFSVFFMWGGVSIGFYLIYMIARYREAKLDSKVFALIGHRSFREGHEYDIYSECPLHRNSVRGNMVNPVHPIYPNNSAPIAKKPPRPKKKSKK